MPTYEYACSACGHQWEQTQRITEAAVEVCPSCAQPAAHRLISGGTHFILKGGGWYSDLYGSPKPAATGTGEKAAASESTDKSAKNEAKADPAPSGSSPAAKTEPAKPAASDAAKPASNAST